MSFPHSLTRRGLLGSALAAPAILTLPAAAVQAGTSPKPTAHAQRFQIGDIEVFALSDGYLAMPTAMMAGFEPAAAEAAADAAYQAYDPDMMRLGINAYVIRSGDRVVAVDSGTPSAVGDTVAAWADSLALAGIAPGEVDTMFQTHLHMDHIGGLGALGQGTRALPNAQMVVSQAEWDFTHSDAIYAQAPEGLRGSFDMARALVAPYAADRVMLPMDRESEIAPGLTAVPLPGHTPGHMGLRVTSGDHSLLIWADALHVQAFQFAQPDWNLVFDADFATASATRHRVLDMAAADRLNVAGSHLDFPSLGYVERSGAAYRYVPGGYHYG